MFYTRYLTLFCCHNAKTFMYVIVINDNILLVYMEGHMTRTSKKDEFVTRGKQYVVLGCDEVSALMISLCT